MTTEAYPYTAASAGISSAIFDEGWQEKLRMTYGDIQWQDTGERLTEETFNFFQEEGGTVIFHMMDPAMIELAMRTPLRDGGVGRDALRPRRPSTRSAGTFSRVLGRYVRDQGVLSLPAAIKKITLMPAERLQEIAPLMRRKGRIQIGAIADITVFDPDTIIDTANFEDDLSFSEGVAHVVVDGVPVVRDGALVEGVFPGKASARPLHLGVATPPNSPTCGSPPAESVLKTCLPESRESVPSALSCCSRCANPDDPIAAHEVLRSRQGLGLEPDQLRVFDLLARARRPRSLLESPDAVLVGGSGDHSVVRGGPWLGGALGAMETLHERSIPTFASAGASRRSPGLSEGGWSPTMPAPRWGLSRSS